VYLGDWLALFAALDSREAGVTVEAKGKEQALAPLGSGSSKIRSVRHRKEAAMHENPSAEEIRALLEGSRTVAVVGLSDKPYRTSHSIARALQDFGFRIFPVNPNLSGAVLGEEPYASVEEIGETVDIVDVFRRSEKVMATAKDAVAAGAEVLWMQSGVVNQEAAAYAEENGLTVVMDRCIMVDYVSLVSR
jgi:uncharacterized protein